MKAALVPLAPALFALALAGCGDPGPPSDARNPAPTAGSHQPENPGSYGTGAQETRDGEEAREADSPNDDGAPADDADAPQPLPARPR